MTGFQADRFRAAAVAAIFLISPLAAAGQSEDSRSASGPPTALGGPAASAGSEAPTAADDSRGNESAAIQVKSLGTVDGPAIGLLDSTNGGLGSDIWQDTSRSRVEDMFTRLPLATAVASVHALARRLVLTTADAPAGDAAHAFLSIRLRTLLDAGLLEDAGNLAAKAAPKNDSELARVVAASILLAGRAQDACGPATDTRLASSDRFWVKLRAFCYAASGDSGALDLTLAVMRAQGIDGHAFETLLDDVLLHRSVAPGTIAEPDALDVFLLQTLGLPVDPDWSQQLGMAVNVIAMRDAKDTPARRLEAAEAAARAGAATTAELAAVADSQTFAPEQLANADSVAPTLPFLAGQALLRQAVRDSSDPASRKRLLFEALALADEKNLLPLAAQLQGSAASAVVPDSSDRAHAALVAAALMLSGRTDAAARWYDVLDLNSNADKSLIRLMQIELNLVAPNPARAVEAQGALSWFAAQAGEQGAPDGSETASFTLLTLGIYDALGMSVPPESKPVLAQLKTLPWSGREPAADVLKRVTDAPKDRGSQGDAILSMLDFIGADGPSDIAPDAVVACVNALAQMGYATDARDLAIDALLLHHTAPAKSAPAS